MPFSFYKTFRLGPVLFTLSPRGLSVSLGHGGVRVGRGASGRRFMRLNEGGTRIDVPLKRKR